MKVRKGKGHSWRRVVLWGLLTVFLLLISAATMGYFYIFYGWTPRHILPARKLQMSFDGSSAGLQRTQVVPTLDTPIEPGKNAVWCASFAAAWKAIQRDITEGPVELDPMSPTARLLNSAPDPAGDLPERTYIKAGRVDRGVIDTITSEMTALFPGRAAAQFPLIAEDSLLAYAYLEAQVSFTMPYFESRKPLVFIDSEGRETEIRTFGVRSEDAYAYDRLRSQPRLILNGYMFAMDLCRNSMPNQVVVACVERKDTLADILAQIPAGADDMEVPHGKRGLGINDELLVPDIFYRVRHNFSDIEGASVANPSAAGQRIDVAVQEIMFRLDRSGAELKSEAKTYMLPDPQLYHVDRPFLVYIKKRGAENPFFVMWVDNAELLQPW